MPHRILIVDDDEDFNMLLTDVYAQATYDVVSVHSPHEGLKLFSEERFDLVVTDERMPGLKGHELIREIRALRQDVPIVVVSGFLENRTIVELINEGVGGVFLKPLNIFSLLKKTSELIEANRPVRPGPRSGGADRGRRDARNGNASPIRSFPCKVPRTVEFARQLENVKDFNTNLLLIGKPGTHFAEICRDVGRLSEPPEEPVFLTRELLDPDRMVAHLRECERFHPKCLTLVVLDLESMKDDELGLVYDVLKKRGKFGVIGVPLRAVFCLHEDIDSLYDRGAIDENLYIFLGTIEVMVPSLNECAEDIPQLALDILNEGDGSKGGRRQRGYELASEASDYLMKREWKGNHEELRKVVLAAARHAPGRRITADHLLNALQQSSGEAFALRSLKAASGSNLAAFLQNERDSYVQAVYLLSDSDVRKTATVLGVEESWVEDLLYEDRGGAGY